MNGAWFDSRRFLRTDEGREPKGARVRMHARDV